MYDVTLICNNGHRHGKIEINQNEIVFTITNGDTIIIKFVDHFCVFHEDRSKFIDQRERYTLKIITKQLRQYDFCFLSKLECDNCVQHIQKVFINYKRIPSNITGTTHKFLENIDFSDINKPSFWRITTINQNNNFCETLPENMIVADCISDQSLIESKNCHMYGRVPIINYINSKNKSCLMTSSNVIINSITNQPNRCHVDEAMIAHMSQNIPDSNVYIVQITTISNSILNQVSTNNKEKNIINQSINGTNLLNSWIVWTNYNTYTINVLPITQLSLCLGHILISLNVLPPKYYSPNTLFGLNTENSAHFWLNSIYMCVSRACTLTSQMVKTQSIFLLMEETGVDYTFIISTLCQFLIEPTCRTINGFLGLIYREWFHNGHPFETRHNCILPENNLRQNCNQNNIPQSINCNAPVFFLFLNCVKTIIQKYCRYFEFNENLLLHLFKYSYECKNGNNEKSRKDNSLNIKNSLLWNFNEDVCINRLYINHTDPIICKFWPHDMELWDTVFLQPTSFPFISISPSQIYIEKVNKIITDVSI